MKKARIAALRKSGVDRPARAREQPPAISDDERLRRLEQQGLIRRGTGKLPEWLGKRKPSRLRGSVLQDLLDDRRSGW
jgi:hypothetical protein